MKRKCKLCNQEKPLDEKHFHKNSCTGKNEVLFLHTCKDCENEKLREKRAERKKENLMFY
jgi:uncharacterized protein YlaI